MLRSPVLCYRVKSSFPTGVVHTGFLCRVLKERDNLEDLGVIWEYNIKMYLQEVDGEAWTGLIWLRIGAGGRRL
jgi:hypothetical protein